MEEIVVGHVAKSLAPVDIENHGHVPVHTYDSRPVMETPVRWTSTQERVPFREPSKHGEAVVNPIGTSRVLPEAHDLA
jgi:hypothetical protein